MLSNLAVSAVATFDPAVILNVTAPSGNGSPLEARTTHVPGVVAPLAYSKYSVPPDSRKRSHCMFVAEYRGQLGVRFTSPEPLFTHAVSAPPATKNST